MAVSHFMCPELPR